MAYEFRLPDLGEGIAEAEIRRWLIKEGETVEEHQSVLEVETDKAVVEVPTPKGGRVLTLNYREGELVPVGEVLLTIAEAAGEGEGAQSPPKKPSYGIVGELPEAGEGAEGEGEVLALPAARALARERGIDLKTVTGSGPRGSITREDVQNALPPAPGPSGAGGERIALRGVRRTIARRLLQTQQTTAFVTTMEEVDVTALWEIKVREEEALQQAGTHLTFLPFFMKAVQHALLEFPLLGASVDEELQEIVFNRQCHIGIAVDTDEGLIVPVVRDVSAKSIVDLAKELRELSERARQRRLSRGELSGSTFTITNFGAFGGGYATPIINSPNVAILGCGRVSDRPWVVEGEIAVRKILSLSLTFDHRVTDGAYATRFLSRVASFLEDPGLLFIESV